jgi:hypothetical protein
MTVDQAADLLRVATVMALAALACVFAAELVDALAQWIRKQQRR